jgi:hypothetical protein
MSHVPAIDHWTVPVLATASTVGMCTGTATRASQFHTATSSTQHTCICCNTHSVACTSATIVVAWPLVYLRSESTRQGGGAGMEGSHQRGGVGKGGEQWRATPGRIRVILAIELKEQRKPLNDTNASWATHITLSAAGSPATTHSTTVPLQPWPSTRPTLPTQEKPSLISSRRRPAAGGGKVGAGAGAGAGAGVSAGACAGAGGCAGADTGARGAYRNTRPPSPAVPARRDSNSATTFSRCFCMGSR